MKYSILVSDFDDTLLRSDFTISARNITAIKRYREAGGLFTICSGRTYDSICNQLQTLGLENIDIPILALQGSIIKTSLSKKILFQADIDVHLATDICSYLSKSNIYFHIYVDGQLIVSEYNDINLMYTNISNISRTAVGDIVEFIKRTKPHIQKILVIAKVEKIKSLEIEMLKIFGSSVDMYTSKPEFLEFTSLKAGKGNALKWLAKYTGTDIENIVAIGDSMNDYSMLLAAGVGISVANGVARLQDMADHVTVSNNNDAVAVIIDEILNNKLEKRIQEI